MQRLIESSRVAFVDLVPGSDETIEELDGPLHSVAEKKGGMLLLVENDVIVCTLEDAKRAALLATDALTRVELHCSDEDTCAAAVRLVEDAVRSIGGSVWEVDDCLYVAAPFDIVNGPRGGGGWGAGDRAPLRPVVPTLSGAAELPLPHD